MKRYLAGIISLAFLFVFPPLAASDETLRVGYFTKQPVAMQDPSGGPSGLVVDIVSDIARGQGWSLTWVHGSLPEGLKRLDTGEIDLMVPIAYTSARDAFLDFSKEAFLQSWGCLFTQRGSILRSIPDAAGKRIAYVKRSMLFNAFKKLVRGFQVDCEWVQAANYDELLKGVIDGRYDGGIGDRLAVMALSREQAAQIDGSIVFNPFGLRAAVQEGDPKGLLALFDDYISRGRLDADSSYNRHLERWLAGAMGQKNKRSLLLALVFGIVFLGFIGYLLAQTPGVRRMIRMKAIEDNRMVVNALVAAALLGVFLYWADALITYLWFNASGQSFMSALLPMDDVGALTMRAMFCSAILVAGVVTSRMFGLLEAQQRATAEMAENLRLSEEKYRVLLDKIPAAVVVHGANTEIKLANPKAQELLGLSEDQVFGRKAIDPEWHFRSADDARLPIDLYPVNQVLFRRKILKNYILGIRNPNKDDVIWVLVNADPIFGDDGDIQQVIITFVDITERRKTMTALRASEEKFRLFMENAHDGVLIVGEDFRFEYANSELSNMLGYPLKEIIGQKFTRFLDKKSVRLVSERYRRRQRGDSIPSRYEFAIVRKNGEKRDVEISVGTTQDSKGAVKTIGTLLDITDRKKAEKEIRNAYTIINKSPYVAFRWQNTEGWPVEYVSENVKALFGHSAEDFISGKTTYINVVHPDDLERVTQEVQQFSSEASRSDFVHAPYRIVSKSGDVKWIDDLTRIRRDAHGDITHYEGIVYDVSDRVRTEKELDDLRNYLANIIDSMPSVLIGVDREGSVTQWNSQAQRVTGLPPQEAVGRSLDQVFPLLAAEMEHVREAMAARQVRTDPRRARHADGETRYEDVTVYPLVAGVQGAVIRVDDVTERVRIEDMMVQSEKMLSVGGLAAGMAHEINNPLAGMVQTASVMANRLTHSELPANRKAAEKVGTTMETIAAFMEARGILQMLDNIRQSGHRAAEIVSNMLSFARKSEAVFSTCDLASLLDQTVDLAGSDYDLKKKHDFRHIEIVREYAAGIPPVACEAVKIQQVILNLLRNGAEAMQQKAEESRQQSGAGERYHPRFILRLAHEKESGRVRIEVEDNGPGMDETTRKRVFEPFFTTKAIDRGTGLGLSVSYFIITENHYGEMSVSSIPEKGTTFTIKLPVEAQR